MSPIDIHTIRGKRVLFVHWTQCATTAENMRAPLLPFAKQIDMLHVQSHQSINEAIFRRFSAYDNVFIIGNDAVTKQCMSIQMRKNNANIYYV